jgi:PAS domain S-box-containing protein
LACGWREESQKPVEVKLNQPVEVKKEERTVSMSDFPLSTGDLTLSQINLMLKTLPVDITFVDENDTVRYFSETPERIFKRTPAIIGRKVQNCHPPASVDKVVRIVEDFRAGKRDTAEFWIQMGGKFIHIQYYAMRDEAGNYRGTLEVSQDLTELRKLEGERRLLEE